MGDARRRPLDLATRALPWATLVIGAAISVPMFSVEAALGFRWAVSSGRCLPWAISFAVLLAATLFARARLRPGRRPPSAAHICGLWGALLGPFAVVGVVASANPSSWIAVGFV